VTFLIIAPYKYSYLLTYLLDAPVGGPRRHIVITFAAEEVERRSTMHSAAYATMHRPSVTFVYCDEMDKHS